MKTTEENNRMIAEFMGYELVDEEWDLYETPECMYDIRDTSGDMNMKPSVSEMCFHSSWDWLIPVVNRLNEELKSSLLKTKIMSNISSNILVNNIDGAYYYLIEGISEYNENK